MNVYKWNTPNKKYPNLNKIIPLKHYKNNSSINIYKCIFVIIIIIIFIILSYYNRY